MKDIEFLEMIVKAIVSNPEAVSVERVVDEMGVLLNLKIDPTDMGYVIGRRGQTAQAIRTLLKIVGAKNNSRVNLKIYDPNAGNRPMRTEQRRDDRHDDARHEVRHEVRHENVIHEDVDTSAIDDLKI
ncbi:MAG: KH domain-containing protein [Candidatus Falkowbacteria bacterium]